MRLIIQITRSKMQNPTWHGLPEGTEEIYAAALSEDSRVLGRSVVAHSAFDSVYGKIDMTLENMIRAAKAVVDHEIRRQWAEIESRKTTADTRP